MNHKKRCIKDFYLYDILLFKQYKQYQLLKISQLLDNNILYVFMGENENGYVFNYKDSLKYFDNLREKKLKKILCIKTKK